MSIVWRICAGFAAALAALWLVDGDTHRSDTLVAISLLAVILAKMEDGKA